MKLRKFLVAKAIIELAFVAALMVGAQYRIFHSSFRGEAELKDNRIIGWMVDDTALSRRGEVQLFVDGRFAAQAVADKSLSDTFTAKCATNARCGFEFDLPSLPKEKHEARIYAVHASDEDARRTLQLIGRPIEFEIK